MSYNPQPQQPQPQYVVVDQPAKKGPNCFLLCLIATGIGLALIIIVPVYLIVTLTLLGPSIDSSFGDIVSTLEATP